MGDPPSLLGHAGVHGAFASGFQYKSVGADVVITHHGRRATTLRGGVAARSLTDVKNGDPQELMARLTGTYKHGNERTGRGHPRNRGR